MSKLGTFLRQERNRRGWSLSDLATQSGVPLSTLSRYESDAYRGKPSHANVLLLASAFEMPPTQLLRYIGYPVRESKDGTEREERWSKERALLEGDPRAARVLEMYGQATDEERDTALSLWEVHLSRLLRRRPRSR